MSGTTELDLLSGGIPRVIKQFSDLSDAEKAEGVKILDEIARLKDQTAVATENQFHEFYELVFQGGWTTSSPVARPKMPVTKIGDTIVQVGTWKSDVTFHEKGKTKPTHRLKGQPAYMKAHVNGELMSIEFKIVDVIGGNVKTCFVEWTNGVGMSEDDALSAVWKGESVEIGRIDQWNRDLAVHRIQTRLVQIVRDEKQALTEDDHRAKLQHLGDKSPAKGRVGERKRKQAAHTMEFLDYKNRFLTVLHKYRRLADFLDKKIEKCDINT